MLLLLFSCSVVSDSLQPHGLQLAKLPCPSVSPRACSNSCLLSQWCHPTISSSVAPFSSCPQGLFQWISFLQQVAKVLELQLQHQSFQWISRVYFLLDGLVGSPWSPRDSQESSPAPKLKQKKTSIIWCSSFLWSNSHICTWLVEKP